MTIELPGLNKADSYKSSQGGLVGGFVKNDAAGELLLDQVGPPTDASKWSHIETKVINSPVSNATFSGLDGDVDELYKLTWVQDAIGTGSAPGHYLQPNGIAVGFGSGITIARRVAHPGGPYTVSVLNANNGLRLNLTSLSGGSTNDPRSWRGNLYFWAKTGRPRSFVNHFTYLYKNIITEQVSGWWFDETTNITSLRLFSFGPNIRGTFSLYKVNI